MKQPSVCTIIAALAALLFIGSEASAQRDLPRFEIGGQFSLLSLNSPSSQDTIVLSPYFDNPCKQFDLTCQRVELGFGGRFTYNLTKHIALEAEGNFFPGRPLAEFGGFAPGGVPAGHIYQGQFGVKAGKRFKKVGIFMKIRPGFVGFTQTSLLTGFTAATFINLLGQAIHYENAEFRIGKATYPSVDVGGVVEFYPSRRLVTRLDVGDTIIRYGIYRQQESRVCPTNGLAPCNILVFERPAETRHNLQFSAGIGIRF
jgi:hypothetical protein